MRLVLESVAPHRLDEPRWAALLARGGEPEPAPAPAAAPAPSPPSARAAASPSSLIRSMSVAPAGGAAAAAASSELGVSLATFLLSLRLEGFLEPLRSLGVESIAVRARGARAAPRCARRGPHPASSPSLPLRTFLSARLRI